MSESSVMAGGSGERRRVPRACGAHGVLVHFVGAVVDARGASCAHQPASGVASVRPSAPCTCSARSSTRCITCGTKYLIIDTVAGAARPVALHRAHHVADEEARGRDLGPALGNPVPDHLLAGQRIARARVRGRARTGTSARASGRRCRSIACNDVLARARAVPGRARIPRPRRRSAPTPARDSRCTRPAVAGPAAAGVPHDGNVAHQREAGVSAGTRNIDAR